MATPSVPGASKKNEFDMVCSIYPGICCLEIGNSRREFMGYVEQLEAHDVICSDNCIQVLLL